MPTITSNNPYTGEILATYETLSNEQVEQKIETAYQAQQSWRKTSFEERKTFCYKLAEIIRGERKELSELETREMGMLNASSFAGLEKTAQLIEWMADNAEKVLGENEYKSE